MNSNISTTQNDMPTLHAVDGVVMADSRDVARHFGKEHKDVLRAIRDLDCSPEFSQRNFTPSEFTTERGKTYPRYDLTRDGLSFLIMGFTGPEAAFWKECYITAFNLMEAELRAKASPYKIPSSMSEALRLAADESDRADKAEATAKALTIENEKLADDSTALARISDSVNTITMRETAQTLGVTEHKFKAMLNGWRMIHQPPGKRWIAYAGPLRKYLDHRIHRWTNSRGEDCSEPYVVFRPSALEYIEKRMRREADQVARRGDAA